MAMAGVLLLGGVLVVVASLFWFFWSLFFRFSIDCGAAGLFVWWFYFFVESLILAQDERWRRA